MLEEAAAPSHAAPQTAGHTVVFFTTVLGLTWLLQLPAVLAKMGILAGPIERYLFPALLGGFGPIIAAIIAARVESGGPGVRALFARFRITGFGPLWYVVALVVFAGVYVTSTAVYRLLGGTDAGRWLYLPENAQHVGAMILMPLVEEPGWRGFALPRLQPRYGALRSSLLLGVAWALWHTMMFILQGATPMMFVLMMVNVVAGSVVFSWIYNHTRGSLTIAVLAHVGVHWNNPTHALPAQLTPFVVYTVGIVIAACALVICDREVWHGYGASPVLSPLTRAGAKRRAR